MRRILIISLLLSLLFYSCASTGFLMAKAKVNLYRPAYPAKEENAEIDIYRTKSPEIEYIEIGEISCDDTNDEWALKQILFKARKIGADGIIILGKSGSYGVGIPIGNLSYVATENYGISTIAIRYME